MKHLRWDDRDIYSIMLDSACGSIVSCRNGWKWIVYRKVEHNGSMIILSDVSEGFEITLDRAKKQCLRILYEV